MTTWLEDYKRRLDGIVASKQTGVSLTGNNDLSNAYAVLAAVNTQRNSPASVKATASRAKSNNKGGLLHFLRTGESSDGRQFGSAKNTAVQKAFSSSFNAGKSGASHLIDYLSRPTYAVQNTLRGTTDKTDPENFFEAMWKGFSGQEKTTHSDVLKQWQDQHYKGFFNSGFGVGLDDAKLNGPGRAVGGFLGDVFMDPTTYIGAGLIGKAGKAVGIGKKAAKIGDATKADVEARVLRQQEKSGGVGRDTASDLYDHIQKQGIAPKTLDEIGLPNRPFEPKMGSTLTDAVDQQRQLSLVTARANAAAITDELGKIPARRYTSDITSKITPPFNTKIEPTAPVKSVTPRPKKGRGLSTQAATEEANYRYLITNPDAEIAVPLKSKPGTTTQVSIDTLRKMAESSPDKAPMIDTLIRNAAKNLSDVDGEARIFLGNPKAGGIPKSSAGGSMPSASFTREQFIKLLTTGEVPKNKGGLFYDINPASEGASLANALKGGSKTDSFPLHDAEDLNLFSVVGLSGEAEPVGAFLERLGVKVRQVDPAKQAAPTDVLDDLINNAPDFTGKAKPTKAAKGKKSFSALTKDQRKAWVEAHKELLDPADIKALLATKISTATDKAYADKLAEIVSAKNITGFKTVDDLATAIKDGRVDPDDLKKLMTLTGAKTPAGIKRGLDRIFKALTEAEKAAKASADEVANSGKLWETAQPVNTTLPEHAPIPVKPASEILHDIVVKGDDSVLVHLKDTLDPKQIEDLDFVLKYAVDKNIVDPDNIKKYGLRTFRKGSRRNSPKFGEGDSRNFGEWNQFAQLDVFSGLVTRRGKEALAAATKAGITGQAKRAARSAALREHVLPVMRAFDKILVENGIPPTLAVDRGYTLGLVDVIDAFPKQFVEKHLFDMLTEPKTHKILHEHIPPTLWSDAAAFVLDYSRGLISADQARSVIKGMLTTDHVTKYHKELLPVGTAARYNSIKSAHGLESADQYINGIVDEFMGKAQVLSQAVENKAAELVAKSIDGAKAITDETMKSFAARITDPNFVVTDIFSVANDQDAIMASIAKSLGITSKPAMTIAKSDVMVKSAEIVPPEVMAEAKGAEAMARVMESKAAKSIVASTKIAHNISVVRVTERQMVNAAESAAPFVDDMPVVSMNDLMQDVEATFSWKILHNFAPHLKNEDVRPIFLSGKSATQTNAKAFQRKIAKVAKNYTHDEVMAGYRSLQLGDVPANPKVAAAAQEIRQVVSTMFRDDKYDIFTRNGITPEQVNRKIAHFGIPEKFALNPDSFKDTWKSWQFEAAEHPLDIISKYQAAIHSAVMERQLGAKLSTDFGSRVPKKGYVKIKNDKALLSHLLDPTMYFPREVAEQFSVLNKLLEELAKPAGAGSLSDIVNMYDSVLHAYKTGLTIYRPGHHFRNMVGDMWFSWMDGVNNPLVYSKAMQVMRDNWGQYTDWDALQALAVAGETNAKTNKIVTAITVAGKKVELTTGDIFKAARERGLLPDYGVLEDVGTNAQQYMWKPHLPNIGKVKAKGKLHDVASGVSESRDHYVRLAHFIDKIEKGKGGSLDEIFDTAANRVRKWHPDGSDLTQFETKVMRRSVLFYSWQRKAIPLVLESILQKPGKVMVFPKAMYALAEANGVDPNSFSDPFPEDQLFPDWIRDGVTGPQFEIDGQYWGINPGIPAVDILNDYGNTPGQTLRTVAGSMPMGFKQVAEYVAADQGEGQQFKDLRTGVPSFDRSDYIDSQLPGISYLAKITGRSPSTLGLQEVRESTGMTPAELQKAKDKNTGVDNLTALFNAITGASAMNMSKPSYIKGAQFDQKKAIKKAIKDASR